MKKNRYFILLVLVNFMILGVQAQGRKMTIDEVDSLAALHNLQLKTLQLEVDAAEGQLAQARKYENPEVQLMHNIQNPLNRRWFDVGYDGQTDIQISQPIAIGGQYKNKVKQARASLNATRAGYQAEKMNVRREARTAFIDLYNAQQKLKVYDKEIASVEKIHKAFDEQAAKGNGSKMETFRIAAMLNQLRGEKMELMMQENNIQKDLRLLLNLKDETGMEAGMEAGMKAEMKAGMKAGIEAEMDENAAICGVAELLVKMQAELLAKMQAKKFPAQSSELSSLLQNHPEIIQAKYQEESAQHAIRVEKSEALPRISLNGEWDKNGSIGHNFFAVGATVSLPLWNRNQGNIRSAKAQYAQAAIERQQRENELQASFRLHYQATLQNLNLVEEQKKQLSADIGQLLSAAEEQFLKRNISVIEFVDLYSSYRDTQFMLQDAKAQLLKSCEELKKYAGFVK